MHDGTPATREPGSLQDRSEQCRMKSGGPSSGGPRALTSNSGASEARGAGCSKPGRTRTRAAGGTGGAASVALCMASCPDEGAIRSQQPRARSSGARAALALRCFAAQQHDDIVRPIIRQK